MKLFSPKKNSEAHDERVLRIALELLERGVPETEIARRFREDADTLARLFSLVKLLGEEGRRLPAPSLETLHALLSQVEKEPLPIIREDKGRFSFSFSSNFWKYVSLPTVGFAVVALILATQGLLSSIFELPYRREEGAHRTEPQVPPSPTVPRSSEATVPLSPPFVSDAKQGTGKPPQVPNGAMEGMGVAAQSAPYPAGQGLPSTKSGTAEDIDRLLALLTEGADSEASFSLDDAELALLDADMKDLSAFDTEYEYEI